MGSVWPRGCEGTEVFDRARQAAMVMTLVVRCPTGGMRGPFCSVNSLLHLLFDLVGTMKR